MNGVKRNALLGLAVTCGVRFFWPGLLGSVPASVVADAGPAQAQSRAESDRPVCVSADLLQRVRIAGSGVVVEPSGEQGNRGAEAAVDNRMSLSAQGRRNAYEVFEEGARKGDPAAEVDLAVAALTGWSGAVEGGTANADAALYWLNEAARQGYALAYFDLGVLYQSGCRVRQDYAEAARYFQLGAGANHPASQMNLGYLYDQGLGVPRDRGLAAAWYRRAAEQGLPQAQFDLGDLYARGEGVERNESKAFVWFERAAMQGHTTAQLMLAAMCQLGRGTNKDSAEAYAWLNVALQAGDKRAESRLESVARELTQAQLASAQASARSLRQSIAATMERANKREAELAALR